MHKINRTFKPNLTHSKINSILDVLSNLLKKDTSLANDLLSFLNDRNIEIPTLSNNELIQLVPVSYEQKNSPQKIEKLKNSFDGMEVLEFIL